MTQHQKKLNYVLSGRTCVQIKSENVVEFSTCEVEFPTNGDNMETRCFEIEKPSKQSFRSHSKRGESFSRRLSRAAGIGHKKLRE